MDISRLKNIILREFPLYYISRIVSVIPNHGITCRIRGALTGWCFGKHGKAFSLAQGGIINYPEKIELGDNVYIAHRSYINAKAGLIIENNVTIGPGCVIATTNHDLMNGEVINEGSEAPIRIKSGSWIGGNVIITSGVTIGSKSIIGAGAVVTKDIPDCVMAAGIPAKEIKKL